MKLKLFVIGLLFGFTAFISSPAESAGLVAHRLLPLVPGSAATKEDEHWKVCGNYFASFETTRGKLVYFTFERGTPGDPSWEYIFATADRVIASKNEKVPTPLVVERGNGLTSEFFIVLTPEDYETGLPCFVKGEEI